MTTTISARIDKQKKQQAEELFAALGMNLSTAVNLFITAAVAYQGVPFEIRRREAKLNETAAAMAEARQLVADPKAKYYDNVDELFNDALK